ncbi:prepilin-type N-terminal cleavage/methylation domain-containing protein [Lysinibacillus sp. NPDC058147]|uniref:prepilin-type N-terminal cleavage/methylation domain-containing protein n=1 Tax=unclassified Lysinibacillus TaxID=2636778 RepID=UPI0036D98296
MFKKLVNKKRLNNEKGLTLIELLAVIVILAIIAAIAIPAIGNIINKSKDRAILAEASNILAGAKIAYADGVCDGDKKACNQTTLKDFVEGIKLPDGTLVTYSETNKVWTIAYPRFLELKLKEFKIDGSITENDLNKKLTKAGGSEEGSEGGSN